MSNKDINLSRKSSQNPNSPTYVNDEGEWALYRDWY